MKEGLCGLEDPKRKPKLVSPEEFQASVRRLTGGKSEEEMFEAVERGEWPFAISEGEMRDDVSQWRRDDNGTDQLNSEE